MTASPASLELLATVRRELAPEGENRFVRLVADGTAPRERLQALACEEHAIVRSDQRSFALLAARFPESPAGDFYLSLAQGEGAAFGLLRSFASALGLDQAALEGYRLQPGCQAYPAYVAWLALNGSRSDAAFALVANLDAWGSYCREIARGLRRHYGLDGEAVGFFDFFAEPPPGFEEQALAVVEAGLEAGAPPQGARRAARLLQAYELGFWDTLAGGAA
jgi:TENA/THI-4/PQQC family